MAIFVDAAYETYKPKTWLTYNDVLLLPQKSKFNSRNDPGLSLSTQLSDNLHLDIPIISANMDTVTGHEMSRAMSENGGMGILHRFYNSDEDYRNAISNSKRIKPAGANQPQVAFSVGCDAKWPEFTKSIIKEHNSWDAGQITNFAICVDVAHGHMQQAIDTVKKFKDIKTQFANDGVIMTIIAGNVVTPQGVADLALAGADVAKIGVGSAGVCSTRLVTGHGSPQLTAIMQCSEEARRLRYEVKRKIGIIADGGIRHSGDIVKALAAGADAVMLGQMLAGTEESPGDINSFQDGSRKKLYRGQSSKHFLKDAKKTNVAAEGIAVEIPYKGSVRDVLAEICGGIRSGFTYSGCGSIYELQRNAMFVEMTSSGWEESTTHITGIV